MGGQLLTVICAEEGRLKTMIALESRLPLFLSKMMCKFPLQAERVHVMPGYFTLLILQKLKFERKINVSF